MILLAVSFGLLGQTEVEDQKLIAGDGEMRAVGVGLDPSREVALERAFEDAINRAVGTLVSSAMVIENDELIKDEIISLSRGFIKEYKITDESAENGMQRIAIIAIVSEKQIGQTLAAKGVEVEYNAGGMFANIDNYEKLAEKEVEFVSTYLEHLKLVKNESIYDYELEVGEPQYQQSHGGGYVIPLTVVSSLNQNAMVIQQNFIQDIDEIAYETVKLVADKVEPYSRELAFFTQGQDKKHQSLNEFTIRPLNTAELNRLRKEGLSVREGKYLDIFEKEFSPYIVVFKTNDGYTVHKFLHARSIELIKEYASMLFPRDMFSIYVSMADSEQDFYGVYCDVDLHLSPFGGPERKGIVKLYHQNKEIGKAPTSNSTFNTFAYIPYQSNILSSSYEYDDSFWSEVGFSGMRDRQGIPDEDNYRNIYSGIIFWNSIRVPKISTSLSVDEDYLKNIQSIKVNSLWQTDLPVVPDFPFRSVELHTHHRSVQKYLSDLSKGESYEQEIDETFFINTRGLEKIRDGKTLLKLTFPYGIQPDLMAGDNLVWANADSHEAGGHIHGCQFYMWRSAENEDEFTVFISFPQIEYTYTCTLVASR